MNLNGPVLIAGGGIGGLTCAVALRYAGYDVQVFEQAPEVKEVGAGLGLWAGPSNLLKQLGVGDALFPRSMPLWMSEGAAPDGRVLQRASVRDVSKDVGETYVVHRADLLAALYSAVPSGVVRTNARVSGFEERSDSVVVRLEDGSSFEGSLLIGADGVHSKIRAQLFGDAPVRYSGETCFRGIVRASWAEPNMLREIQGKGQRFGMAKVDDERVYWFATWLAPFGEKDDPSERRERLIERYRGWAFRVPELIAATPTEAILRNDLIDRPPLPSWSRGRVTLMGDAAHPTTPNLGQGACMAIEDGVVLARELQASRSVEEAFQSYEAARLAHCNRVVKQSLQFGKLAQWKNPVAVKLRETLVRITPQSVIEKAMKGAMAYVIGPLPQRASNR